MSKTPVYPLPSPPAAKENKVLAPSHSILTQAGGVYYVVGVINDKAEASFVVDSGATNVLLNRSAFERLSKFGPIPLGGKELSLLANGSLLESSPIMLRTLRVGDVVLENVVASVAMSSPYCLLGQSFLRRLKGWKIVNNELVIDQ